MKNMKKAPGSVDCGWWPEFKNLRFLFLLITLHLAFAAVFYGCAAPTSEVKESEVKEKITIEKISVIEDGKGVLIEASGPITYTAFKLTNPDRLIIDIPDVNVDKVQAPIDVNNEFLNTITAASYEEQVAAPIGRIEIGMKVKIGHEVKLEENRIVVSLNHETTPEAVPQAAEEKPVETVPQQEGVKKEEAPAIAPTGGEEKEAKQADRLIKIETIKADGGTIIKIIGNGTIGDFNSFAMDKPARLVVDIWNVANAIPERVLSVGGPHIKRVRIGEHPNKVRFVFDYAKKTIAPHEVERFENTLIISAGTAKVEKPEAAASIKAIDFTKLKDKGRLIITASKRVAYRLYKPLDEMSLVLDIQGVVIPEELRKTLDASDLNTAVAAISSFQSPVEPEKDVRIIVKLKEKTTYNILQEGDKIWLDFPFVAETLEAAQRKGEAKTAGKSEEIKEAKPAEDVLSKVGGQEARYTGRKISLDFKDADINNILRLMAEISNLNIIAGEDVKGKVSLRLIDVPWDQAFEIILKTNGLGKIQEGNVVRIMPVAKIKQETEEALASRKALEKLEDMEIRLVPINYATASSLEPQIKGLLSDRGSVSIEERTNTMIIKDIPANIAKAVDLIKRLDTPTPQVLIEARIIEAESTFARDLGVQWGVAHTAPRTPSDSFTSEFGSTTIAPPNTLTPTGFIGSGGVFSSQPNFAVSLPAAGTAGTLGALGFSFGKLVGDPLLLDLRISAGEKNGLTKTISRPRITTLDNKEAKISQGDSVPFETTSASGTQTQFIDATLALTVTPHITPDGSVSMKIKASRNSIGSFRSATGTPSISKKEASTEIIVKDGETAVIGGIVVADKSDASSGIPFLKEIPILGWLFKNKSLSDSQRELLIFITPNIVKGTVVLSTGSPG